MCPIPKKVKRFLENNFTKIYLPIAKNRQHPENSAFFYLNFFLVFLIFLSNRTRHDSFFMKNLIRCCKKNAQKAGVLYFV